MTVNTSLYLQTDITDKIRSKIRRSINAYLCKWCDKKIENRCLKTNIYYVHFHDAILRKILFVIALNENCDEKSDKFLHLLENDFVMIGWDQNINGKLSI